MKVLELIALGIVVSFVLVRARFGPEPKRFLWRMAILVVASWIAEDSCIRAYGFYYYDAGWSLFVDRVPLAILLIWPVVIHSAWELASHWVSDARLPLAGGALVLADASMIEPIAVHSGLWTWTEPGLFEVPPIGIIGWAYYAGLCMWVLGHSRERPVRALAVLVIAPLGTHLLLLASWWGLFRWLNGTVPAWPCVALAWGLALILMQRALGRRLRDRIPPREMLSRVPAALFFFALLWRDARDVPALVAWGLAFAPPYLALTRLRATPAERIQAAAAERSRSC